MIHRLLVIGTGCLLAMVGCVTFAATAGANSTVVTYFNNIDFYDQAPIDCGFPVQEHQFGSYKEIDYYDNNGALLKIRVDSWGGGYYFAWSANGVSLTSHSVFTTTAYFNPDGSDAGQTQNGLIVNFHAPGYGTLLIDTGTIRFDANGDIIHVAGPHQFLNGDTTAICAALSGT
jgi:hypothetical protein